MEKVNVDLNLGELLGTGTFGEVYSFYDNDSKTEKALKIEKKDCDLLRNEYKIYRYLNKIQNDFIPNASYFGHFYFKGNMCNVMIMDFLGPSLQKLHIKQNKMFSEKTVMKLAINMIKSVEYLHSRHFVHRDIKPDNFAFGRNENSKKLYLIDLGLAKKYRSSTTYLHIPEKSGKSLIGTARYASINVHNGEEQSRRDDLESLGYCLLFFVLGKLPWQGLRATTKEEKHSLIKRVKQQTSLKLLCEGLHRCFYDYMKYVRELEFKHLPDYAYLIELFDNALYELSDSINSPFEWESDYE
ncbi:Casein kinase (serine/threonine/tyrosine protein kinase) [Pseudoloma neurophilia]|uniref:Casein kinase (Serine/threonine/tyrosine protein kinase) n=1 Tax=Pseudoloma neurophilia TaxID=146866 RepID=A0A0R0LT91_9MICR|nr:Casein kinase (serine/threonine/tyrosine protein kinase) [Pseudoloma neurophilia]